MKENRIKKIRESHNLTQEQLGNIVNKTATAISYWENGKAIPTLTDVITLANYFGVSMDYICGVEKCIMNINGNIIKYNKIKAIIEE